MRLGYSILLGEYIDASHVDYTDCEAFQIVCPACHEPIFKVARLPNKTQNSVEYLSHYAASDSYQIDCELRVKNISEAEYKKQNSISRNQRLEYFLSVLRQMIGQNPIYTNSHKKAHSQLNGSKTLKYFREKLHEHIVDQNMTQEIFYNISDEYVDDITSVGGNIKTAFSISVQKRIAFDMWEYLLSKKGQSNFDFLFNHGYVILLSRLMQANTARAWLPEEELMASYLSTLINIDRKEGMHLLSRMGNTPVGPPFAIAGSDLLSKTASEITHEMIGALVVLPFFEQIKNAQKLKVLV
jgi:hypothetical protein